MHSNIKFSINSYGFKDKFHNEEFKKHIGSITSVSQSGTGNSQYGTCWINNGSEAKKIKNDDIEIWLSKGWLKGRKWN